MRKSPIIQRIGLCTLILLSFGRSYAQEIALSGRVTDENGLPLQAVSISIADLGMQVYTDSIGMYRLHFGDAAPGRIHLRYSFLGMETVDRMVNVNNSQRLGTVVLHELSYAVEEVNVTPSSSGQSNSSMIIDRGMIERYPSLSLNDLLNFLPNRKVAAPSVQSMQNLTLRGAFQDRSGGSRDVDQLNNAFGISIIIDDIALSNNANMQGRNPLIRGISNSNLSIPIGNFGGDERQTAYSGESTFGGIDLRQIPTESIERIEVISGVAPARYGDLSDGAVIIERQAGRTPTFVRVQARNNATSYGLSKGLVLSPKLGHLNVDLSYVNSFADNRDKLKQYQRVSGSAIWTATWGREKRWKHTLSGDYNKILDGVNEDPDDPQQTAVHFGSWNSRVSSRLSYQPNSAFIKRLGLNLSMQNSHQASYREFYSNQAYVLYTDTLGTGVVEGQYVTGQYTAVDHIDGRPMSVSARLEANAVARTGHIVHRLNFGTNLDYSKNKGQGRLSDPSRPVQNTGAYTERYYDYSLMYGAWNLGFYLDDRIRTELWQRPLNINAGVRWDIQNGYHSLSPRLNMNYQLSPDWNVGLAYGIAVKAPGLAHLYPGPSFTETVLLNAYNGKVNESTNRIHVLRHDQDAALLKAQFSQNFEASFRWNHAGHRLIANLFLKENRNGINSVQAHDILHLPEYQLTARPGEKPLVEQIGTRPYFFNLFELRNSNHRQNMGLELIYSTPKVPALATSFLFSGGITSAATENLYSSFESYNQDGTDLSDVILGVFNPFQHRYYMSNGRVSSVTHIPKLRLIVELTADFQLLNKEQSLSSNFYPVGYYTREYTYHPVNSFDPNNVQQRYLYEQRLSDFEERRDKENLLYGNFHLNVAKEIGEQLRISFNVYNFLDYQPRIRRAAGTSISVQTPNRAPSYGAQLTYKFK